MKVLFCAYDFVHKVGGPNAWLLRLLPALQAKGVDIAVLFFSEDPARSTTAQELSRKGVACTVSGHLLTTEEKVSWILQQFNHIQPDVFVPNLMVPAYYAAGWVRQSGVPTIGVLHSDDAFHRGLQDVFVFGEAFFQLSAMVCVSRYLEEELAARHPGDCQVRRIPYGAPIPEQRATPPEGKLRLAYAGRLVEEQKRISDLTKALCRVAQLLHGVEATLFGVGPDQAKVENILTQYGEDLPVRLAGLVPSDLIQQELVRHHVFVLLSDYEGLPIALMEAMACGLVPVCLRMRSGLPELVEHEVNGLIVDDREESFVKAIRRLKDEPALWQRLSQQARATVVADFSSESGLERWFRLLEELSRKAPAKQAAVPIPTRFHLPAVHPALAREDVRRGVWPLQLLRTMRKAWSQRCR